MAKKRIRKCYARFSHCIGPDAPSGTPCPRGPDHPGFRCTACFKLRTADIAKRAMAALEEWCSRDDVLNAEFEVRRSQSPNFQDPLPWMVYLRLEYSEDDSETRFVTVYGKTMADALAQAAQVVVADPMLESSREGG